MRCGGGIAIFIRADLGRARSCGNGVLHCREFIKGGISRLRVLGRSFGVWVSKSEAVTGLWIVIDSYRSVIQSRQIFSKKYFRILGLAFDL